MPHTYMLRNIDDQLWRDLKQRAETEARGERGLRAVVVRLFELYAAVGLQSLETAGRGAERQAAAKEQR